MLQLVVGGAVVLYTVCTVIAWSGAGRHGLSAMLTRPMIGAGAAATVLDFGGLGTVLGGGLVTLGALIGWESMAPPEIPRPRGTLTVVVVLLTGTLAAAVWGGVGPLATASETYRLLGTLAVGGLGSLLAIAAADRARVRLRDQVIERLERPSLVADSDLR